MSKKVKKNSAIDPEYGLDSRYTSKGEQQTEAIALMKMRLERMQNLSREQIVKAKLIQLKLAMEEYIKSPVYDDQNHFLDFLETYVDTIYSRRNKFAKDVNISSVRLSQIINKHRSPSEDFLLRLMVHSEKVYESICEFKKMMWYQVFFYEKIYDTMASQDEWRPSIEKEIKLSESLD